MNKKVALLIPLVLIAISGQSQELDSIAIKDLITLFQNSNFIIKKDKSRVDSFYLNFRRSDDEAFCFANPNEQFNSTDLRHSGFCNARLKLYGTSTNNSLLKVILYEEDHGGGPGKQCDIYLIKNGKVSQYISFSLHPKAKSIASIKLIIKKENYTIVNSYNDE